MEIDLQKNEPIHGALARYATDHCKSPLRLIHRLLPGTNSNAIAFVLPHHLQLLLDHLPPKLGLKPEQLATQHTFFPAIAPFLETSEADLLLHRMIKGGVIPPYPICHMLRYGEEQPAIRYCPVCAANDRSSTFAVARWRMAHQLFGIGACAEHKCRLIATGCGFSAQRVFHDAEVVIPTNLPEAESAEPNDIQMAVDLACLFSPTCPRPGRRRIAGTLSQRAKELFSNRATPRGSIKGHLCSDMADLYGIGWLQRLSPDLEFRVNRLLNQNSENCPAVFSALLGRFLGLPLSELLAAAINAECSYSRPPKRHRLTPHAKFLPETIEIHRRRILELRRKRPNATRSEIRSSAPYSLRILNRSDPKWTEANLPAIQQHLRLNLRMNWPALDAQKEAMVRSAAKILRGSPDRPKWVTVDALRKATIGSKWSGSKERKKLPLLNAALEEERDTPFTYAQRVMRWLCEEIGAGRCKPFAEVRPFLVHAKLSQLARKYPEIPVTAEKFLTALSTNENALIRPADKPAAA